MSGGETITLADGVTMRVVRWNHSGDPATNPEQHNPVELTASPRPDPATGGLRAGVAEDFPNGGGNRAFLFTVDVAGRALQLVLSELRQRRRSPTCRSSSDGQNYGAPIDNLKAAMKDGGPRRRSTCGSAQAGARWPQLVLPVIKPKAYLPVHWDGLYGAV